MIIDTAGDRTAQWGEGSIWVDDRLHYVDIEGKALLSCNEAAGEYACTQVDFMPATLVPRQGGGFLCAGERGIYEWDGKGSPRWLLDPEGDRPDQRLNDGKCSPDGRFFVGSINPERAPQAGLYRLDPDMSLHKVLTGISNSNGIAWSPDGEEMFYIDTPTRKVSRFSYKQGNLTNRRDAFSTSAYEASPDGMCIDAEGRLWIAMCHAGCVVCYSPDGKVLEQVDIPCREVTSCAFGGASLDKLYVTTGVPSNKREDLAGRLFVVSGTGAKGLVANRFLS